MLVAQFVFETLRDSLHLAAHDGGVQGLAQRQDLAADGPPG
ncbi:hypothetical protein ACWEO2_31900 [Nocardia sp. NPDC004278]